MEVVMFKQQPACLDPSWLHTDWSLGYCSLLH